MLIETPRHKGTPGSMSGFDAVLRAMRAALLVFCFVAMTLLLIPVQWLAVKLRAPASRVVPLLYHRFLCRLIGIRMTVRGLPEEGRAVLMVANHTSWLDIPILSAQARLSFVAKTEVNDWPFFGLLARLQRTVFVARGKRTDTQKQRDEIQRRLGQGDTLVLFPEGTSSDGNRVLAFNSALFSVAEGEIETLEGKAPITVQPVSIAYTRLHGLPLGRSLRPLFAWYGDMSLVPHLWEAFGAGPLDVQIQFHPLVTIRGFASRKELARHCERAIAESMTLAIAGRPELAGPGHIPLGAREDERKERTAPAGII
jgi:1-acyl-sn-glycerol-3-phosphate acyltransferase